MSRRRHFNEQEEDALLSWWQSARSLPSKALELKVCEPTISDAIKRARDRRARELRAKYGQRSVNGTDESILLNQGE